MDNTVPTDERRPYFQMMTRDWLSGQATCAMTPEQKGGFVDLLCHAWNSEDACTLPDDDAILARLSGLGDRWSVVGAFIKAQFKPSGNGRICNAKLKALYDDWQTVRQQKSVAGEAGGKARAKQDAVRRQAEGKQTTGSTQADDRQDAPARAVPIFGRSEHRSHASCGRVCVPAFLHNEFIKALGGAEDVADTKLRAWYGRTLDALPEGVPVPSDALKFWRARFDAEFTTPLKSGEQARPALANAADLRQKYEAGQ